MILLNIRILITFVHDFFLPSIPVGLKYTAYKIEALELFEGTEK
jgi:hypothetical protein